MRVLMANKFLYPRAGAETYMLTVAAELKARGHEVAFFGMEHPENTKLGTVQTIPLIEFGMRFGAMIALKSVGRAAYNSLMKKTQRRLDACIESFKPDLIHAHNIYNQLSPSLFVKHVEKIPVVMTVHDYKPICPNYSLFTRGETCTRCLTGGFGECVKNRCVQSSLIKSALAAASSLIHKLRHTYTRGYRRLISPSGFLKRQLVAGGIPEERVSVLNNFAAPAESCLPPGEGILYFGRLCREKGVHTLLDAYAAMSSPRPMLSIAGEGPLSDELKGMAARHGLNEIRWLGRIPPSEVARELDRCAVSVVPSVWYENCSMAILESLARGRPVIASDSGGNAELIRDGIDGLVFRAGDADELRAKLVELTGRENKTAEMGQAAHWAARERFSPAVHIEGLLANYELARG
ncbi:MAG TPA: glycosyltransferase family 4 protein [Planctomycetota bacterium]|nr:glycosyltransferase family 4 protein [Planctomycetota bacterium]